MNDVWSKTVLRRGTMEERASRVGFHLVTVDVWQGYSDAAGLMKSAETPMDLFLSGCTSPRVLRNV